jgi:hypothetical protein
MKKNIYRSAYISRRAPFLFALLLIIGCSFAKVGTDADHGSNVLSGQILIKEGNCMPGPNTTPCKIIGNKATVLITSLSESYNQSKLIEKIESDTNGFFSGEVSQGDYSVFIEYKNDIHCSYTICDIKCFCTPTKFTSAIVDSLIIKLDLANY